MTVLMTSLTFTSILLMVYCTYQEQVNHFIKKTLYNNFFNQNTTVSDQDKNIIIKYSENDEEFILKEILPELKEHKNYNVHLKCINSTRNRDNFIKQLKGTKESNIVLVIFSPNYLTSAYSHVNIKKIRGEMLKSKNTVYVFTDIGPENSIYAFLKEQRDLRSTILWSDPNFWSVLIYMLSNGTYKRKVRIATENEWMTTNPFLSPDSSGIYSSSTFAYNQV